MDVAGSALGHVRGLSESDDLAGIIRQQEAPEDTSGWATWAIPS
jgi:hypothetical protein